MRKKIYCIGVVRWADMFVEATDIEEALNIAYKHVDHVPLEDFADSDNEVKNYDTCPRNVESNMDKIYTENGVVPVKEYIENLEKKA